MLHSLDRLFCHAIDFGYLCNGETGRNLRRFGRQLVRTTANYPRGCLTVATLGRVAEHFSALPNLVDPEGAENGPLIVSPVYARDGAGHLYGAWVVAQRFRLYPNEDREHMPGDATRSRALIFQWDEYGAYAPRLAPTFRRLRTERVPVGIGVETRLNLPREQVPLTPPLDGLTASRAAAVMRGVCRGGHAIAPR